MGDQAEARRRAATWAFLRYFVMIFAVVVALGGLATYAVVDARRQSAESHAIRLAYCTELEKLKTQNREDVAHDKKNYARNLRLLGLHDTPELRKAVEEGWARRLRRNAAKSCPYTA